MNQISVETVGHVEHLPLILTLNSGGEPLGWINYERCVFYYAKNKVLYSLGQYEVMLRGGINAKTGLQSRLIMDTIIALDNKRSPKEYRTRVPSLTNKALFIRDERLCAYCGNEFKESALTRDHVKPRSKGGPNTWDNVVTSCKSCNNKKDDNTPEQAGMPLLYIPYTPNYNEHLILCNRRILADQMEFLRTGIPKESRLHARFA